MIVTQWFEGINPAYIGVYQRKLFNHHIYSYWNGKQWLCSAETIDEAATNLGISIAQNIAWRGIAK